MPTRHRLLFSQNWSPRGETDVKYQKGLWYDNVSEKHMAAALKAKVADVLHFAECGCLLTDRGKVARVATHRDDLPCPEHGGTP